MPIHFLISSEDEALIGSEALAILASLYGKRHQPYTLDVEIECLDRDKMQKINFEQRKIDSPTDVLSFPTLPNEKAISTFPAEIPVLLGSIVLCPSKAEEYGESLPQLVHHGLLHLLGFDHVTDFSTWHAVEVPILQSLGSQGLVIPEVE